MGAGRTDEYAFDLSGGALCLDFANTVGNRPTDRPHEYLNRYDDLVAFARQERILSDDEARRLRREAARRPAEAQAALARARQQREVIQRLFEAVAAGRSPADVDLADLNAALPDALKRQRVARGADEFAWTWSDELALDRMLWPILRSAAEVLTSRELAKVRACSAETCAWLFLDTSRNHTRRWCDMKVCGNRSKARRHYQRKRTAPPS